MFKWILLLNALIISAVAAYYSILGLIVIFAASVIPVAVMASALEVGKIMTATYLHNHWKETGWILKTYLTSAVAVLMLITSLGIFGFLSKAHIEQGLGSKQIFQQIEQIDRQITRLELEQEQSETRVSEQIESKRIQTNNEIDVLNSQIRAAQRNLENLSQAQTLSDIRQLQTIVGVKVDGKFGPNTETAVQKFVLRENIKIEDLNSRIKELNDRLEDEIKVFKSISNEEEVRNLIQERFILEKKITQFEAEVGPIKYVAEVIYGESNNDLLEQAVRWMIIIIVLVFDPLAIAMLLAFNTLNKKETHDVWMVEESSNDSEGYRTGSLWNEFITEHEGEGEEKPGKVEKEQENLPPVPKKMLGDKKRGKHAAARKGLPIKK